MESLSVRPSHWRIGITLERTLHGALRLLTLVPPDLDLSSIITGFSMLTGSQDGRKVSNQVRNISTHSIGSACSKCS